MTSINYQNPREFELKTNNINSFSYNLVTDSCTTTFLSEVEQDFFDREVCDLNVIMSPIANSQFKSFFKLLNTDTPEILNKTTSLERLRGLTFLKRFSLYLSRAGFKEKSSRLLMNSFFHIIQIYKLNYTSLSTLVDWRSLHSLLTWNISKVGSFQKLNLTKSLDISDNSFIKRSSLLKANDITISNILMENFKKFNYLFSFYIYKVDKQIYKNSRGKSGKYTFVWKYVAPYKRNFLIMHWLSKEVRISSGKTLQERLDNVLKNFVFNPHTTWIWKIKKFSLNYVYFNLRRTLGETYRTSMR